jgi:TP901 family phage tail tape measure protein
MALGTRELLLVIRARDEASRVLGRMSNQLRDMDRDAMDRANRMMARGGAMVSAGAGIAAIGAAGIAAFAAATEAAIEYENQAARTLTQTADIKTTLEEIKDIGRDVARDIPAPFEKMQDALFTIFSTIETDAAGAEKVLREMAQSAVAGQTDLQAVTEGSLQVLNGFQLGVDDVRRVSDVMFELVAEGVGTFEEFVSNIGKATPSANRMGQSVEDLAGMMAFLTRNGLSGAMAATSAARSFDLLANPKVIERLDDMGVAVVDNKGNFRSMSDIVNDLAGELGHLSAPERAEALNALFAGSGNNVQARRFFDLAIPGFRSLNDLTGEMVDSSGAMERAYGIMLESPKTQTEQLTNRFKIMVTEIGDRLIPVKLFLMETLGKVLGAWEALSPEVQNVIIITAGVISVFLVLAGIATMLGGALLIMNATIIMMGGTMAGFMIGAGIVIAALAAIGVAIYLVIKYWDEIKAYTIATWNAIVDWFQTNLGPEIEAVKEFFRSLWESIKGWWDEIVKVFETAMGDIEKEVAKFAELTKPAREFWDQIFPYIKQGFEILKTIFKAGLKVIVFLWNFLIQPIIDGVKLVFTGIGNIIEGALQFIQGIIDFFLNLFTGNWSEAWDGLVSAFQGIGKMLLGAIQAIFGAIWTWLSVTALGKIFSLLKGAVVGLFNLGKGLITGLWNGLKSMASSVWNWVKGLGTKILETILEFVLRMGSAGRSLLTGLWNGIKTGAVAVWNFFKGLPGTIWGWVKGAGSWLWETGSKLLKGAWEGIKSGFSAVQTWFLGLPGKIWGFVKDAGKWLLDTGKALLEGLWNGITGAASWLWDKVVGWLEGLWDDITGWFEIGSPSKLFMRLGQYLMQGFAKGIQGSAKQVNAAMNTMANDLLNKNADWQKKVANLYQQLSQARTGQARARIQQDIRQLNVEYGRLADRAHVEAIVRMIRNQEARLVNIANARTNIAKRITAANKALAAAIKTRDAYAVDVRDKLREASAITGLATENGDIAEQLKDRLRQITEFRENMAKLQGMGLSKTMYGQLIEAGLESGAPLAEAMVADGAESVKALSDIQKQIDHQSAMLGKEAGNTMHGAGVAAAQGLLNGLKSQDAALGRQARAIATNLVREVKRALGIRSPSAVFAEMGVESMLGMARGLLSAAPTAANAAATAAGMVTDSFNSGLTLDNFSTSTLGRGGDDPGAMTTGASVSVVINTQEINPLQHAAEVGNAIANRVA